MAPDPLSRRNSAGDLISVTFAHLDVRAFGIACGCVCGAALFLATAVLLIRGGEPVGPNLALLGQYFAGYRVTWSGSVIGALYGFAAGYLGGAFVAMIRNFLANAYLFLVRKRIENSTDELP